MSGRNRVNYLLVAFIGLIAGCSTSVHETELLQKVDKMMQEYVVLNMDSTYLEKIDSVLTQIHQNQEVIYKAQSRKSFLFALSGKINEGEEYFKNAPEEYFETPVERSLMKYYIYVGYANYTNNHDLGILFHNKIISTIEHYLDSAMSITNRLKEYAYTSLLAIPFYQEPDSSFYKTLDRFEDKGIITPEQKNSILHPIIIKN